MALLRSRLVSNGKVLAALATITPKECSLLRVYRSNKARSILMVSVLEDCLRHHLMSASLIYSPLLLMTCAWLQTTQWSPLSLFYFIVLITLNDCSRERFFGHWKLSKSRDTANMCFRADKIVHRINLCHFHSRHQLLCMKDFHNVVKWYITK